MKNQLAATYYFIVLLTCSTYLIKFIKFFFQFPLPYIVSEYSKLYNKNELDSTYYFIVLLIHSTYFGHYYAHHQELATIILITTLVVSFLVCCMLEVRCG